MDSLGELGSAIWIGPLGIGAFMGGSGISIVESVAWTTWAFGGWRGYAGWTGNNCLDLTGCIFLGGHVISVVGLFSGVWTLNGWCGFAGWAWD